MFKTTQAILIKIPYADGVQPEYERPYLVIDVTPDYIKALNVSSFEGKELKLLKNRNEFINNYNPPFLKPSFVKLDSVYIIEKNRKLKDAILCEGKQLDKDEFEKIYKKFIDYKEQNPFDFAEKRIDKKEFYKYN